MAHPKWSWKLVLISLAITAAIAGCASIPSDKKDAAFTDEEHADIQTIGPTSVQSVYPSMLSDDVRELRLVEPVSTLVLDWEKRTQNLAEDDSVEISSGTLRLGPDYFEIEEGGEKDIFDFALRRFYSYMPGEPFYTNSNLFGFVAIFHMETMNRAALGKAFEAIGRGDEIAGHQQFWFESELHVRARNLPPITVEARYPDENTVAVHWENDVAAEFRFGELAINPPYSGVLARALRYKANIHPAALAKVVPFSRIPNEVSSLHAHQVNKKARTTITFSSIREETVPFPLPKGLHGIIWEEAPESVQQIIEIGTNAIEGKLDKRQFTLVEYAADAAAAEALGDPLGTWLPWLAASLHYPDLINACNEQSPPEFCTVYHIQTNAALKDRRPRAVLEASMACARGDKEQGVRKLLTVDFSAQKHRYVVNMILGCLLRGLPQSEIKDIVGHEIVSRGSMGNAILALEGNPYIPSFYVDIGNWFAQSYDTFIAWMIFDIGRALGGGVPGDAFDQLVSPYEIKLMGLYPGFF